MSAFSYRPADPDDAQQVAALYRASGLGDAPAAATLFLQLVQTGHAFLVAERGAELTGAVRTRDEEGIGWFDLLVSAEPWAGAGLVRAVERACQDRGIRLVRARCPDAFPLPDYFGRLGYLPIGRQVDEAGEPELLLERRLPLLTVREQRRSDAEAIGQLIDEDPWVFEQGARPGWFVASDGDRVVGVIQVADGGAGLARVRAPSLLPSYRGRNLELWMLDRAATYAETNGYHSAMVPADPNLDALRRGLEDRYWQREGDSWRRVFFVPRPAGEDDD
jgi:GNAT superfamily N-acetyltransferase